MSSLNITKARKIVSIAYYTILNRAPDEDGLKYWSNLLVAGKIDETDLSYSLFSSKEYAESLKKNKR